MAPPSPNLWHPGARLWRHRLDTRCEVRLMLRHLSRRRWWRDSRRAPESGWNLVLAKARQNWTSPFSLICNMKNLHRIGEPTLRDVAKINLELFGGIPVKNYNGHIWHEAMLLQVYVVLKFFQIFTHRSVSSNKCVWKMTLHTVRLDNPPRALACFPNNPYLLRLRLYFGMCHWSSLKWQHVFLNYSIEYQGILLHT